MNSLSGNGYALLIGVDDYAAYDRSEGKPPGTSDLRGSLNDVRVWLATCLEIGIPRENIRVLSSPAPSVAELGGAEGGPATAAAIREGVLWLAEKLKGAAQPVGVLVFSGHGDLTKNDGLVICPSDVTASGDDLVNDVSLSSMQKALGGLQNLTTVLDCCHSGGGMAVGSRKATSLRGLPWPSDPAAQPARPAISDRVFFAAQRGQSAYQAAFGSGQVYGAFTWAFMTVKSQWTTVRDGATEVVTIWYGEMQKRALMLLEALSFGQVPELECADNVARLPLFNPGEVARGIECEVAPDAKRTGIQADPGWKGQYRIYTFTFTPDMGTPSVVAQMLVSPEPMTLNTTAISANTEYWLPTSNFDLVAGSSVQLGTLTVEWVSYVLPEGKIVYDSEPQFDRAITGAMSSPDRSVYTTPAKADWQSAPVRESSQRTFFSCDTFAISLAHANGDVPKVDWYKPEERESVYAVGTSGTSGSVVLTNSGTRPTWWANAEIYTSDMISEPISYDPNLGLWGIFFDSSRTVLATSTDGRSWSSNMVPLMSNGSVAGVANKSHIYVAAYSRNVNGRLFVISSSDNWSTRHTVSNSVSGNPALIMVNGDSPKGTLIVGFVSSDDSLLTVHTLTLSDSATLSFEKTNEYPVGKQCYLGPALALFKGNLYLAYCSVDGPLMVCSLAWPPVSADASWSEPEQAAPVNGGFMALTVFNGNLYLAYNDDFNDLYVCSFDGAIWSSPNLVSQQELSPGFGTLSLASFEGQLYIMFSSFDVSGEIMASVCSSTDGWEWSGPEPTGQSGYSASFVLMSQDVGTAAGATAPTPTQPSQP